MGTVDIILQVLNGVIGASDALAQAKLVAAKLEQIKAEGRDPTDEEFQALFDQIAADTAAIHSRAQGE